MACDVVVGQSVDEGRAFRMAELAEEVFDAPYELYPGVPELLRHYSVGPLEAPTGWRLVLLTKGDVEVQQRKVKLNELERRFHKVWIVPTKGVATLQSATKALNIDEARSWVIGDSIRDDIAPAKELGIKTIHVMNTHGRWGWETGKAAEATHSVHDVTQMRGYVPQIPPHVGKEWYQEVG